MDTRIERLKNDPRIKYVAEISGGRHIIEIPLALIETDEKLVKIRGTQPKTIALLQSSIKDISGDDSLYCISLYMPDGDGEPRYFIGDGLQRYKALVGNGETKTTFAQVVLKWRDLEDAIAAGLSANMARFAMSESDIFSIMDTDLLSDREIMRLTDFKESTIDRIRKVHKVGWMRELVDKPKAALPYTRAANLIKACDKDSEKLAALKTTITQLEAEARDNAEHYQTQGRTQKLSKKDAKKATLKYWFDQEKDRLDQIISNLENGQIEKDDDGEWQVVDTVATKKVAAMVGRSPEWEKRAAVSNFFDKAWDELTEADVQRVYDKLPDITEYVGQQLARMKATKLPPMRSSSDKHIDETEEAASKPQKPKKQKPTSAPAND